MEYETPDVGSMVRYEYDQDPEGDYGVARGRGEVLGAAGGLLDVDDNGRTVKIDLEAETVTVIVSRSHREDDRLEYPLTSYKVEEVSDHLIREDDLYDNADKYTDELDDVQGAIARANAAIGVVHRESDADFISQYDAWRAADVYENGIEQRLAAHNESDYGVSDRATIVFPNDALENPDDYDAEWYLDHELPHERQEEIVDEHLEKHNLSKHQETQVTMTAILHYGPSTPDDE